MMRTTCFLIVGLMFAASAFATGPVAIAPEDGGETSYGEPIMAKSWTDLVSWTMLADAPQTFRRAGGAALGDYFYCFGSQSYAIAQAYNMNTGVWASSTPAPFGTCNWDAVATDDHIYMIGCYNPGYLPNIQRFTPTAGGPTGVWDQMAPWPLGGLCGVAAAWDPLMNCIFAAGGNGAGLTNAMRYDIGADTWTAIASMPVAKKYCGGAFLNGKFYVVGGYDTQFTIHEYDPIGDTWTAKANSSYPMFFPFNSTCSNGSYVIVLGGGGHASSWPPTDVVQLYDPTSDTWSVETPLPQVIGVNAADYAGGGTCYSAGGNNLTGDQAWTNRGDGFPGGGPPPDVTVFLDPYGSTTIPASGGTLTFLVGVTNNEAGPATFDAWTDVTLPSGAIFGPLIGPINLTLSAGQTVDRDRTQDVPAGAPPGAYTYNAYAGFYPDQIASEAHFDFEKLADGDGGAYIGDWSTSGDLFEGETPEKFALMGNYPNPFNPTTTIEFSLNHADFVELRVFDVTGRQVTTLVDGFRDAGMHEVTFDAAGMATGLYVYRLTSGAQSVTGKMILMK